VAVTLDTYLYFDSGAGASVAEAGWRASMKHMLGSGSGVIRGFGNDFQTIGDSSGMQVKVNTGECWMYGHYGASSAQKTLAIASNSSGNPRIDIVVLRCHFGNNNIVIDVVQGTPAASPTAPNVTQNTTMWETKLADVAVANGAVTITSGNVTDRRVYTLPYAKYTRTTNQSISHNTVTDVVFNSTDFPHGEVVPNSTSLPSVFTLNRAGLWMISAQVSFDINGSNSRLLFITDTTGTPLYGQQSVSAVPGAETIVQVQAIERFSVGQTVKVRVRQLSTITLNLIAGLEQVVFIWVGP
jgi:hypothetical protein